MAEKEMLRNCIKVQPVHPTIPTVVQTLHCVHGYQGMDLKGSPHCGLTHAALMHIYD